MKKVSQDFQLMLLSDGAEYIKLILQGAGVVLHLATPSVVLVTENGTEEKRLSLTAKPVIKKEKFETSVGVADAQVIEWVEAEYKCRMLIGSLQNLPASVIQMTFENLSGEAVELREFQFGGGAGSFFEFEQEEHGWNLSSLSGSDFLRGGICPNLECVSENANKVYSYVDTLACFSPLFEKGIVMGAIGPAVSDIRFNAVYHNGSVGMEVISEMNDVQVKPGMSRCSEQLLLCYETFDKGMNWILEGVKKTHGSRTKRGALSGWCSWYYYKAEITEECILDVVNAFNNEWSHIPVDVIQTDDGYQKSYGEWSYNEKFPNGIENIKREIENKKAIPGIWMSGLLMDDSNGLITEHPDWFQHDRTGQLVGAKEAVKHLMDPSHPEVMSFVTENIRKMKEQGFQYFKIDFSHLRGNAYLYDRSCTRLEAIRNYWRSIREILGEDIYLTACVGAPRREVMGYADASRVGTDCIPRWGEMRANTWNVVTCIQQSIHAAPVNNVVFAADPDVCYLLSGEEQGASRLTTEENKTWYGFVGLLGGLTMISDPIHMPQYQIPEVRRKFERLIPPAPDKGKCFMNGCDKWHRQFGLIAKREFGSFASVMLWNPDDTAQDMKFSLKPFVELGERFHVWSLWTEEYWGIKDSDFEVSSIAPHGNVILRISQVNEKQPVLVGTNLHIAMGSAEIADVLTEENQMKIRLTNAGAREGAIVLYFEKELHLNAVSGMSAQLVQQGENLWRVEIKERSFVESNSISIRY